MKNHWSKCPGGVVCCAAIATLAVGMGCQSVPDGANTDQGDTGNRNVAGDVGGPGVLGSMRLGGDMTMDELIVPPGTNLMVTSDLHLDVQGNVLIDGDLIAEASTGDGYSIMIEAGGDIEVSGSIEAGDGAMSAPATARIAATPGDFAGANGGTVQMISREGHVTIFMTARVRAGDGSDGLGGFMGAPGGRGGSVALCAFQDLTVRGSIHVGNGGNGSDADMSTAELPALLIGLPSGPDGLGNGTEAKFGNRGGDSGRLFVTAANYDFPFLTQGQSALGSYLSLDVQKYTSVAGGLTRGIIDGGIGGQAGAATVLDPPSFVADQLKALDQSPPTGGGKLTLVPIVARAAAGGHGWTQGGLGGAITIAAAQWDGKDGKAIEAIGGNGGSVTGRADPTTSCGEGVIVLDARAGFGGIATAGAAAGLSVAWAGGDATGGVGGPAIAVGGDGGYAEQEVRQYGGDGGAAMAFAGSGGNGRSSCFAPDPQGQGGYGSGGAGGGAEAIGGNGGDGYIAGLPGTAQAIAGVGGNGGDGAAGAGLGGDGGSSNATIGFTGQSILPGDAAPQRNDSDRPHVPGTAESGAGGVSGYLAPPEFCPETDYECPNGQL